jgi:hypothetical protein
MKLIGIEEFAGHVSKDLMKPTHLAPLLRIFEQCNTVGGFRTVVAIPPQHGCTVTILHSMLWLAMTGPNFSQLYVTYNADAALYIQHRFTELANGAGFKTVISGQNVQIVNGGTIKFTSIGGSICGFAADLTVIDNPYKDRADAESPSVRSRVSSWFRDVAMTRRKVNSSILCVSPRWNKEDLSGELISKGYSYLNFKAIAEGPVDEDGVVIGDPLGRRPGQALFPDMKAAQFFNEERQDPYTWNALYQGTPLT